MLEPQDSTSECVLRIRSIGQWRTSRPTWQIRGCRRSARFRQRCESRLGVSETSAALATSQAVVGLALLGTRVACAVDFAHMRIARRELRSALCVSRREEDVVPAGLIDAVGECSGWAFASPVDSGVDDWWSLFFLPPTPKMHLVGAVNNMSMSMRGILLAEGS